MSAGTTFSPFPGDVFYTIDGTDPASPGSIAIQYGAPVVLNESVLIMARTKSSAGSWSALRNATFLVGTQPPGRAGLTISEIHYNPDGPDDLEFIEVANRSSSPINLTGVRLTTAVEFEFGEIDLMPGAAALVVGDEAAFDAAFGISAAGQWSGRLNNAGETIDLLDPDGAVVHSVSYGQGGDWPSEADGKGFTLQLHPLESDPALPASWRLSTFENGTPGTLPAPDALTVERWRAQNFSPAELAQPQISGLSSDPDGDGLSNLLEFAFAMRPLQAESKPAFQTGIETIDVAGIPQRFLTLTFDRPMNSELQYTLQKSSDLSGWKTRPLIRFRTSVDPSAQVESLTVREKQPMVQSVQDSRTQLRLRIGL